MCISWEYKENVIALWTEKRYSGKTLNFFFLFWWKKNIYIFFSQLEMENLRAVQGMLIDFMSSLVWFLSTSKIYLRGILLYFAGYFIQKFWGVKINSFYWLFFIFLLIFRKFQTISYICGLCKYFVGTASLNYLIESLPKVLYSLQFTNYKYKVHSTFKFLNFSNVTKTNSKFF